MFDRTTGKFTLIDTCFPTHHLQFGFDANDTLWASGGGPVIGWLNVKKFLETGDAKASQGWAALALDTPDKSVRGSGSYAIIRALIGRRGCPAGRALQCADGNRRLASMAQHGCTGGSLYYVTEFLRAKWVNCPDAESLRPNLCSGGLGP